MLKTLRFLPILAAVAGLVLAGCNEPKPGLARGKELFDTCKPCHGTGGLGNPALKTPSIAGLPEWYVIEQLTKFKGDIRGAHPKDAEGARMRPLSKSLHTADDIASVAKYVVTLRPHKPARTMGDGDVAAGAERYGKVCVVCHGAKGEGNEALKAPPLYSQSDWYAMSQLRKFKSGMRGADSKDIYGAQMRAMAMTLEDDKAMLDVVSYIMTLSN